MSFNENNQLTKFENFQCPTCSTSLNVENINKTFYGSCPNNECGIKWVISDNKGNPIQPFSFIELIEAIFDFWIELPFNLGLPSGTYEFYPSNEDPLPMRVNRGMYYFQKGNEVEYPLTHQPIIIEQFGVFDSNGLVRKHIFTPDININTRRKLDFSEFGYKRKMKTVLMKEYKILLFTLVDKETFFKKFRNESPDNEFKDFAFDAQRRFYNDINQFLMYYSLFFPENDINNSHQHEIRPLSIYELSKYETFAYIKIEGQLPFPIPTIIEDFTSFTGFPDVTYTSSEKLNEFEKLIKLKKDIPILPHQQIFISARSLYRTSKSHLSDPYQEALNINVSNLGVSIISASFTALEALLRKLEKELKVFLDLKVFRENIFKKYNQFYRYKGSRDNREIRFLDFYFNYIPIVLAKVIKKNNITNSRKISNILKDIRLINFGRMIRNEIVHDARFNYELNTDDIKFNNYLRNQEDSIKFRDLWESILKLFDALDKILLEKLHSNINWRIENEIREEILAISVETTSGTRFIKVQPADWRETCSYKTNLFKVAVPPERFEIFLESNDDVYTHLNYNPEIRDFERHKNPLIFRTDMSASEIKERIEKKTVDLGLQSGNHIYHFKSCINCGHLIHITRHKLYNNFECPRCKNKIEI